jgi:hypothetical protein
MQSRRQLLLSSLAVGLFAEGLSPIAEAQGNSNPWMDDRLTAHLKTVLGLSDAEWEVVSARIEPVLMLMYQRDRLGRPKPPKASRDGQPRDISEGGSLVALKTDSSRMAEPGTPNADMTDQYLKLISLASQPAPFPAELKDTLNHFRAARVKSVEELTKARESLRELMSLKQEAALVVLGILD